MWIFVGGSGYDYFNASGKEKLNIIGLFWKAWIIKIQELLESWNAVEKESFESLKTRLFKELTKLRLDIEEYFNSLFRSQKFYWWKRTRYPSTAAHPAL